MVDRFKFKLPPSLVVIFDNSNPASLKIIQLEEISLSYFVLLRSGRTYTVNRSN